MDCNSITDSARLSNGSNVSGREGSQEPSNPGREFTLTWDGRTKEYVRYNIPVHHDYQDVGAIGTVEIQRTSSGSTQELLSEAIEEDYDSGDSNDSITPHDTSIRGAIGLVEITRADGDTEFLIAQAMRDDDDEPFDDDDDDIPVLYDTDEEIDIMYENGTVRDIDDYDTEDEDIDEIDFGFELLNLNDYEH